MFFNNVMNSRYYGILNPLSTASTAGTNNKSGNISKTRDMSFGSTLQNQRVKQMKQEIYDKFQIENGAQTQGRFDQSAWLLYQKSLMQQAALMPYQMNLYNSYSGYPNLYGLSGLNGMNYSALLQNAMFSSVFGKMF